MGKKGQLLFKGDKRPKKKSKKSKTDNKKERSSPETLLQDAAPTLQTATIKRKVANDTPRMPSIQTGTGKITTSGTVVTGHDTLFVKELGVGDALLVGDEMRVVTMRLSDTSVNLSSAFSQNLKEPTKFKYVPKPKNPNHELEQKKKKELEETTAVERNAFDIYGNASVVTYREKTETGSYRLKQQVVSSSSKTRTDLLSLRSKKTSDKYC